MKDGETVAVKLQKEPDNPFDSRAIAFMCMLHDKWERIGYIVKEAIDPVHDAMRNNHITEVRFDWLKYIVYFQDRGWYAGIMIRKKYEWLKSVLRHCAKTFH